jgi:methyl-accepting chemotaxis protein
MLNNLSFTQRLIASHGLLILISLCLGSYGLIQLNTINNAATEITGSWLPNVRLSGEVNGLVSNFRITEFDFLLSRSAERKLQREVLLKELSEQINNSIINLQQHASDREQTNLIQIFKTNWQLYLTIHQRLQLLSNQNKSEEALVLIREESRTLFQTLGTNLDNIISLNSAGANAASERGDELYTSSFFVAICLLLISVLLGVFLTWSARSYAFTLLGAEPADIRNTVASLAKGEMNIQIALSKNDNSSVLFGVNRMRQSLLDTLTQVQQASNEATKTAYNLNAVVKSSRQSLDMQVSETQQISTAMEEMVASFQEVANSVSQTADAASKAQGITSEGAKDMSNLQSQVKSLASELTQVINTVQAVEEQSQQIGKILEAIRAIAEQTNLLALNAAIEAARAGEQGRGFAVVADEVRTLAQRSQNSTAEINDIINKLRDSITHTVNAVGRGNELVQHLVEQSHQTIEQFDGILTVSSDISGRTSQIATATEEQSSVGEEISKGIVNISSRSSQNVIDMDKVATEGADLRILAEKLDKQLSFFTL